MSQELFSDHKLIIFTDGGARGNPGPAAVGVVVGQKQYGEYIGETTNNVAEYTAVIFALRKAKALLGKEKAKKTRVEINLDSELVAKQLNNEYKILDENLQPLFIQVWNLKQDFKEVDFKHIAREQNTAADRLVNQALDERMRGK